MNFSLSSFAHLPMPLKIATAVVGSGSLLGLIYLIFPAHFWIIMIGLVIVAMALAAYAYFLQWQRKRKAAPMEQGLKSNATSTPQGISEPASVARLDDLSRKFEEGVEKFRAAGKNLYSLPWYVLVGEPGSGKTEAIRHSSVGFPPGLQDQLQGSGGTMNMNWWFTNHGVILDTAGRLMFEEVLPGGTSEWEAFLKLLRSNRPNCPINGMLLTISAESLIKDTADDLERKGGKIAQQLDNIQRALGVRFPVFIMITKCDLINGFREFFDDLTDPALQGQVLGWSNPTSLDEVFDPSAVDQHLEEVRDRLIRRRMRLLLDPVHTEDANERRTDQIDALFAFPDALMSLAPRLRRYLEMIFVAGEWSAKPLFLRGIYFTSAMREGSALDADLANVLGVEVDSLPEGRVWEKDRAYFLRELFLKKVFIEKGLVTRATNTRQLQRQRKGIILGGGLGSLVVLLLLTVYGASSFKRSIGDQQAIWNDLSKRFVTPAGNPMRIVDQAFPGSPYEYNGNIKLNLGDESTTFGQLPFFLQVAAEQKISTPLIFQPLKLFRSITTVGFDDSRRQAMRVLFESSFLEPVLDAVTVKLSAATTEDWTTAATDALAEVCYLQMISASKPSGKGEDDHPDKTSLDKLFRFALVRADDEDQYNSYKADSESLQTTLRWLYSDKGGRQSWPPRMLADNPEKVLAAIEQGVDAFVGKWGGEIESGADNLMSHLVMLQTGLDSFHKGQTQISRLGDDLQTGVNPLGMSVFADDWRRWIDTIFAAKEQVDAARIALGDRLEKAVEKQQIDKLCEQARDQVLTDGALPAYDRLLEVLSDEARKDLDDNVRTRLGKIRSKLSGGRETLKRNTQKLITQLEDDLPKLARLLMVKAPRGDSMLYEIYFDMHRRADEVYRSGVDAVAELSESHKAFPFCRTKDLRQELASDKAQRALELLGQLKGSDDEAALGLGALVKQGVGGGFYKEVRDQMLKLLSTARTLAVGGHRRWYKRIAAVGDALANSPPLACEVFVLPFTEQKNRPNIDGVDLRDAPLTPHRYFEVHAGDNRVGQRMQTDNPPSGDLPRVTIPGKKISIQFFHHEQSKHADAIAEADAPWTLIKSLHALDAISDDKDKQQWKVCLILKDMAGVRYYYWIGLRFSRPIPKLDAWPTESDWPQIKQ